MVVEHRGLRGRWQRLKSANVTNTDSNDVDPSFSDPGMDWEHVEQSAASDLFGLARNDVFDDVASTLDDQPVDPVRTGHFFMQPKPKIAVAKPPVSTSLSIAVRRTADEMASTQIHKSIADIKQPWQTGPLSTLFARPKPFWERLQRQNKMPLVGLSDHIASSSEDSAIPKPIQQTELTVQRIRASRPVSSQDDYRYLALSRFKTMVLLNLDGTRLGQSLRSFAGTLCPDDELSQIFMDVFAPKATGTILKRCNVLWRFSGWLQTQGLGSSFCQDEKTLYQYVCHLRQYQAGPTTPSQFLEAMRFSDALLGFTQVRLLDMLSARVIGAAHATYMTKRVRRPAEVLIVAEVSALEDICLKDAELHRRVIAGHLLFSFTAAARWHDSMFVVSLDLSTAGNIVLLEALTSKHKSSRGKEQQMELLPFTTLGKVTDEGDWGYSWMDARQQYDANGWNNFLNSWLESAHCWVDSRMSTAEATGWLRELLEPHTGSTRAQQLTVHGLKATLLSWAAKSTLFSADEQLALGHHVSTVSFCHDLFQGQPDYPLQKVA